MSRNKISGSIPKCLGNVSSLRKLFLGSNLLNSSIPPTLWDLKDLMNLDLSSNSLNGALPEEISNLGVAIYVNLAINKSVVGIHSQRYWKVAEFGKSIVGA